MQFREYLQSSGRLLEARSILDMELGLCTNTADQMSACKSMLEACSKHANDEPVWFIASRARLRLAHVLHVCGQFEEARRQLGSARDCLNAAGAPGKSNRADLLCRLQELKDSSPVTDAGLFVNDPGLLERYESFTNDQHIQNDGYILSKALTRGLDVALAILEKSHSACNLDVFWRWSKRTEAVLEEIGDTVMLFINRLATGDIACSLLSDYGSLIKWHKDFDAKYPTFNLWSPKINACKTLALIHTKIRNEDRALKTAVRMKEISSDQDMFWQAKGFRTQAEITAQDTADQVNENLLPVTFQNRWGQLDWMLHDSKSLPFCYPGTWKTYRIKVGSDEIDPSTDMDELLLKFMRDDFADGVLDRNDLKHICSGLIPEASATATSPSLDRPSTLAPTVDASQSLGENLEPTTFLDTLTPKALSTVLYGTADSPTPVEQWEEIFGTLTAWLLSKSSRPENKRHYLLYQVQNRRQKRASYPVSSFKTQAVETQRLINLIPHLNATVREQVSNISGLRILIAISKTAIYLQKTGHPFQDTESPEFKEVLGLYNQSLAENHGNGRFVREVQIHVNIAQLYFHTAKKLNQRALDLFFQALLNALAALEKIRDGWRALQGWERVENLTLALENPHMMSIIPWAVAILTQYPDSHADFRASMIWIMVQVAKSMGLGWLMEINLTITRDSQADGKLEPSDALKDQGEDQGSDPGRYEAGRTQEPSEPKAAGAGLKKVTDRENTLEEKRDHSAPDPGKGATAEETQKKTDSDSGPHTILGDMEAQLQQLSGVGGDAVFVDWYNGKSRLQSFLKPLITTISPGKKPQCRLADITWQTVDEVVSKFIHLDTEDLKSKKNSKILYRLNPLIEPLKDLSTPGQALVFSPCGNLHRIPLHALKIDGEVLIHRNPIVYCSSLSALTTAFEARQNMEKELATPSPTQQQPSFKASIFGGPPTDIGKKALHATASKLHVHKPYTNNDFKASLFVHTIEEPSLHLLHYHGHANFSASSPMDQSLAFTDQDLTLRQIFDIPPGRRAFHAVLLGCGSGASKTLVTNDVVGLVPALFHAGAASTVSSLRTFSNGDAALYQEYFYEVFDSSNGEEDEKVLESGVKGLDVNEDIDEMDHVGEGGMGTNRVDGDGEGRTGSESFLWNLAVANQRAVLKIREQKSALYHWAGFVLNGWWMMRVPGKKGRERS